MSRFAGKVALVTGAARGIGAACAEVLARDGAAVLLTDVLSDLGETTAAGLRAKGYQAQFRTLDVTSRESWQGAVDAACELFGRLDILVNNAGINIVTTIEDATADDFEKTLRVNLIGPFLGMQQAIRAMKASGGAIVNIASNSTRNTLPVSTVYSPTKAGLANLTKVVALHCAAQNYGIRVNSVHPGATETDMITGGNPQAMDNPIIRQLVESTPLRRICQPSEVAEVVAFLASDAASYMTGEELFVDAGLTISMTK